MTPNAQDNQVQTTQPSDKELNFRALEQKYQRQVEQERAAKMQMEQEMNELRQKYVAKDEEDDSEPYVDHKKLEKKLNKFGQNTQSEIQKAMEIAKQSAKEELKQEMWLESHSDFDEVMKLANKFAEKAPSLANTILRMPEGFDRTKLVYENIKQLGIDKPEQRQSTIQEKIDANRKSPYYQPSGVGTAPYSSQSDFSSSGQKNAYDKMQELKKRIRI